MILNDSLINKRLEKKNDLEIEPINKNIQIQPTSVDLRLGNKLKLDSTGEIQKADEGETLILQPDEFYLAHTKENINLPKDLCANIEGRSSVGRKGVIVETAGFVDAGFNGELVLELVNFTNNPIELEVGSRVAQLVLKETKEESNVGYGDMEDSKYQNQKGIVESRLNEDTER